MSLPVKPAVPGLSGERFTVHYTLRGTAAEARAAAEAICIEQTVEFPPARVPQGDIQDHIVGRIEDFTQAGPGEFSAAISFAAECAGHPGDLLQLMNVALGLSSLLDGVRVDRLSLPSLMLEGFGGPRLGIEGLRRLLDVPSRALISTALKPMGLSPQYLAEMAYTCTLNGLDIVKDDHGITDLPFCPFEERVPRVAEAVARANGQTGRRALYVANINGPVESLSTRARFARDAGAGGLMVCPALIGFDALRHLAAEVDLGLPLFAHPSLIGGLAAHGKRPGFGPFAVYGQITRLAGADASIYTNYGGRFPVTQAESLAAAEGCRAPLGGIASIFPMIGGGMKVEGVKSLIAELGQDSILLVGGGLHTLSDDLAANVRRFAAMVG